MVKNFKSSLRYFVFPSQQCTVPVLRPFSTGASVPSLRRGTAHVVSFLEATCGAAAIFYMIDRLAMLLSFPVVSA